MFQESSYLGNHSPEGALKKVIDKSPEQITVTEPLF